MVSYLDLSFSHPPSPFPYLFSQSQWLRLADNTRQCIKRWWWWIHWEYQQCIRVGKLVYIICRHNDGDAMEQQGCNLLLTQRGKWEERESFAVRPNKNNAMDTETFKWNLYYCQRHIILHSFGVHQVCNIAMDNVAGCKYKIEKERSGLPLQSTIIIVPQNCKTKWPGSCI